MNRTRTAIRPCRFGFAILVILTIGINAKSLFGSINLAWDPNSESFLVGYNVYRSTQPGVFTAPPLNGATPVTATALTDSTAQNNQPTTMSLEQWVLADRKVPIPIWLWPRRQILFHLPSPSQPRRTGHL